MRFLQKRLICSNTEQIPIQFFSHFYVHVIIFPIPALQKVSPK